MRSWKEHIQAPLPCRRVQQPLEGSLGKGLNFECNWSLGQNAFTPLTFSAFQSCSVSRAVSLAVSQLLEKFPDKSPDSCHFSPLEMAQVLSVLLPTPQWLWDKYITQKAFCLLVACPPLTLMSRTHPTATADKQGKFSPLPLTVLFPTSLACSKGLGSPPGQRLLFPTFCTEPGQQPFQKTELNLTVSTHMWEHFPYSHTRMQNYLPRSQAQNTHVPVPLKAEKPWNAVLREPWAQAGPLTWGHGTRRLELGLGCSGVNN